MKLVELVFRDVNVVLVHAGVAVQGISLDRVRAARAVGNIQVTSGAMALNVVYPDDRMMVVFDPQRINVTDNSSRSPEVTPVVETALAQHAAIGSPPVVAFGFNLRFDFEVEGMESPPLHLQRRMMRDPSGVAEALRTGSFDAGFSLHYRRGVKVWTLRMEPVTGMPKRLGVHANVHEDLQPPPRPGSLAAPAWLAEAEPDDLHRSALPDVDGMKSDLSVQARAALDTMISLLSLD